MGIMICSLGASRNNMSAKVAVIFWASGTEIDGSKKNRPTWFSKKKCFKSCYESAKLAGMDFYLFYDGEQNHYLDYIQSHNISGFRNVHNHHGGKTFVNMISFLYEIKNEYTHFYIAEDDHMYVPHAFKFLQGAINTIGSNAVFSCFEHGRRYEVTDDITKGDEQIIISKDCHWRTSESTTASFCIDKNILEKYETFITSLADREIFRELYRNGVRLWTPIPSLSTHMINSDMAHFVNWKEINSKIIL